MSTTATEVKPGVTIAIGDYDAASLTLSKASALLNALSNTYDERDGFASPDAITWQTMLVAIDLVDAARAALQRNIPA